MLPSSSDKMPARIVVALRSPELKVASKFPASIAPPSCVNCSSKSVVLTVEEVTLAVVSFRAALSSPTEITGVSLTMSADTSNRVTMKV